MPKFRKDITNEQVRALLEDSEFPTLSSIARKLDCCESLVRAVRDGRRIESTAPSKIKDLLEDEICSCCKDRKKADGNMFLCTICYENSSDSTEEYHFGL